MCAVVRLVKGIRVGHCHIKLGLPYTSVTLPPRTQTTRKGGENKLLTEILDLAALKTIAEIDTVNYRSKKGNA